MAVNDPPYVHTDTRTVPGLRPAYLQGQQLSAGNVNDAVAELPLAGVEAGSYIVSVPRRAGTVCHLQSKCSYVRPQSITDTQCHYCHSRPRHRPHHPRSAVSLLLVPLTDRLGQYILTCLRQTIPEWHGYFFNIPVRGPWFFALFFLHLGVALSLPSVPTLEHRAAATARSSNQQNLIDMSRGPRMYGSVPRAGPGPGSHPGVNSRPSPCSHARTSPPGRPVAARHTAITLHAARTRANYRAHVAWSMVSRMCT
ncbi:hypothetical protein J6590_010295 [Homalodisca vitripennis]|nr:hypothetical protein J6590_010295 [Homalodisca vitripennis]